MKGELDSELIVGAQLAGVALVCSQASPSKRQTQESPCVEVDDRTSCKRIKATQVNGFIVYTRTKKSKLNGANGFLRNAEHMKQEGQKEPKQKTAVTNSLAQMFDKSSMVDTNVRESTSAESAIVNSRVVEAGIEERLDNPVVENLAVERYSDGGIDSDEKSLVEVAIEESEAVGMTSEEIPVEVLPEGRLDFDAESQEVGNRMGEEPYGSSEGPFFSEELTNECGVVSNHESLKLTWRLARSALKLREMGPVDCELPDVENEEDLNVHVEENPLASPQRNSIGLTKRPMNVKELFDTGLLDGVSVVYVGSFKSQAFGLRGIIKDGGILCSCSFCNWCRVIPPSKFEIHACKQYRRASQYICFENGKSLLEVLKICRSTPLHALEATIREAVSSSTKEKSFTCKRCKGLFTLPSLSEMGGLCKSCSEAAKSEDSPVSARISRSAPVCISSPSKSQLKIIRKPSEPMPKSPKYSSSLDNKLQKITRKSSYPALVRNSFTGASASISPRNMSRWKLKKKSTKQASTPKVFKSASLCVSSLKKNQWKITKKDQRLHKLVFERDGLPDGTELAYYARGQKLLEGYKKGSGIFCYCCKCEVSPSQFEVHAGWASRRKPYAYIYTSNGVSLHEWAITLSKGRKYSAKDNDDLCVICADGGNLLLCDGCPRAFHKDCISLPSIPRGSWYCKYCEKRFESESFVEHNVNAVAAGRVIGADPIEQITRRCICVVKNIEAETSGCILCSGYDFSRSGFGPRTIIICDQCEKEYHIGCLRNHKMADLKELPKGKWFCCMDCTRIHSTLQNLLLGGAEKLSDSSLEVIRVKQEGIGEDTSANIDVRWRLISGKVASPESRILLSQALAIFHDCFDPIVDPVSGHNLIPRMVYGKNMKGQDYGGMCCAVLTVNSSVVSAGLLRVFGQEVAELPLVATSIGNHGKGYFQLLFSCIEKLLSFLNVESIVLPAAEEAESIWMNKFGFKKMIPEQLSKYMKICYQMVKFKGASMLQKPVPPCRIVDRSMESDESSEVKSE